jgi:hypothetical protein
MVGSAILRAMGCGGLPPPLTATHAELDLTDQAAHPRLPRDAPAVLRHSRAARVGGIEANRSQYRLLPLR